MNIVMRSLQTCLSLTMASKWVVRPVIGIALVGLPSGCRNSQSSAGADPLLGRDRIPPQSLPIYGAKDRDPILKGATTTGSTHSKAEPAHTGPESTTAALAGIKTPDGVDSLGFNSKSARQPSADPANTVSGSGTRIVPVSASGTGSEALLDELRRLGGRLYAPTRLPNGHYEFRCAVPLADNPAMRTYTGTGSTQHAAIRDVLEQIHADSKSR